MYTQDLLDMFSALILHIHFTAQGEGYEGGWHRHGTQKKNEKSVTAIVIYTQHHRLLPSCS